MSSEFSFFVKVDSHIYVSVVCNSPYEIIPLMKITLAEQGSAQQKLLLFAGQRVRILKVVK